MGLGNLTLDMYTKIAHVAFHRRMKKGLQWLTLKDKPEPEPVLITTAPKQKKNRFGCMQMTEKAARECGVALAEKCLKDGIKVFSVLDVPSAMADVCISTGEGSSIRGLAQYRITHDDWLYRFDLAGHKP